MLHHHFIVFIIVVHSCREKQRYSVSWNFRSQLIRKKSDKDGRTNTHMDKCMFGRSLFSLLRIVLIYTDLWTWARGLVLQPQQSCSRPLFGDASNWAALMMPSQLHAETALVSINAAGGKPSWMQSAPSLVSTHQVSLKSRNKQHRFLSLWLFSVTQVWQMLFLPGIRDLA